jgi:hypothetical protein
MFSPVGEVLHANASTFKATAPEKMKPGADSKSAPQDARHTVERARRCSGVVVVPSHVSLRSSAPSGAPAQRIKETTAGLADMVLRVVGAYVGPVMDPMSLNLKWQKLLA